MKKPRRTLDVDKWLESGLRTALEPLANTVAPSSRYARLAAMRPVSRLRAVYFAASMIAGLLALTAVTASAATGSVNPVDWGRHISRAVEGCASALPQDRRGIGECANDIVIADPPSQVTRGSGDRRTGPEETTPRSSTGPSTGGPARAAVPGSSAPATGSTDAAPPARSTGNPHPTADPNGNPHTPQNPTGNPHPNATPPGQGGVNPGHGHTK